MNDVLEISSRMFAAYMARLLDQGHAYNSLLSEQAHRYCIEQARRHIELEREIRAKANATGGA